MQQDNGKKISVRDRLIEALETQIEKQEQIIATQEETIRILMEPKTGERIHAQFSAGVVDDVNYGGSIKAFLFLLNNDCCTSIDKKSTEQFCQCMSMLVMMRREENTSLFDRVSQIFG